MRNHKIKNRHTRKSNWNFLFQVFLLTIFELHLRWRAYPSNRMMIAYGKLFSSMLSLVMVFESWLLQNESFSVPVLVIFGWLNNEFAWMNLSQRQNVQRNKQHISYIFNSLTATDQCFKWYSNAFTTTTTPKKNREAIMICSKERKCKGKKKRFLLIKSIKNRYDD